MKKFSILTILILSVLLTEAIPRTRYIYTDVYAEEEYSSSDKPKETVKIKKTKKETVKSHVVVHSKNDDLNENQKDIVLIGLTVGSVIAILYMRIMDRKKNQ